MITMANNNIVSDTPALRGLYRWVLRLRAPPHIRRPGKRHTPPKISPIIRPSTSLPLPWPKATQYKKISTTVEKNALITAPTPIDSWAEIDATAWPMKYASGMIENKHAQNTNLPSVYQLSIPRYPFLPP